MPSKKSKQEDVRPHWFASPAFSELSINILQKKMGTDMVDDVMYEIKAAFEETKVEKDVATRLKSFFERKLEGSSWHCIVGKHFGMSITHATDNLIYFTIKDANAVTKPHHVVLFRSHDRDADEH
mmetsp:Transcript_10262/g.12252  ORF Transcript_10262/g.12252 Transcript_10262/m.12252 type:complete len:125 (-) Transcript_10262:100-474(-)|eukprot:jgi/Bigna1/63742/fgenesh1_kg.59_\